MGAIEVEEGILVGCLTTDFALQNVLLAMNLSLVSLTGYRIKKLKSYVLRYIFWKFSIWKWQTLDAGPATALLRTWKSSSALAAATKCSTSVPFRSGRTVSKFFTSTGIDWPTREDYSIHWRRRRAANMLWVFSTTICFTYDFLSFFLLRLLGVYN